MTMFLICSQLLGHPLVKLFHLSNLLQMLNDPKMVDIEFFSNFFCSFKRISFDGPPNWSLSPSMAGYCIPHLQGSRLLCRILEPPQYCTFVSSSWVKCIVDVVSCLHYRQLTQGPRTWQGPFSASLQHSAVSALEAQGLWPWPSEALRRGQYRGLVGTVGGPEAEKSLPVYTLFSRLQCTGGSFLTSGAGG